MVGLERSLEKMYANLVIDDEEEELIVTGTEIMEAKQTFVLVRKFLTKKNINFNTIKNVMALVWRPKKGMEIHDLGGFRYSFIFYHVMDLQKVIDAGSWSFQQAMLVYHQIKGLEEPHQAIQNVNPDKVVDRAYGAWLHAPSKNAGMNTGSRWLHNGDDGGTVWPGKKIQPEKTNKEPEDYGGRWDARFMEIDGIVREVRGDNDALNIRLCENRVGDIGNQVTNQLEDNVDISVAENMASVTEL
ncbi:hypothetical protein AgCh_015378 [Apium graveolens]